jgi:hypothetical protein
MMDGRHGLVALEQDVEMSTVAPARAATAGVAVVGAVRGARLAPGGAVDQLVGARVAAGGAAVALEGADVHVGHAAVGGHL